MRLLCFKCSCFCQGDEMRYVDLFRKDEGARHRCVGIVNIKFMASLVIDTREYNPYTAPRQQEVMRVVN